MSDQKRSKVTSGDLGVLGKEEKGEEEGEVG